MAANEAGGAGTDANLAEHDVHGALMGSPDWQKRFDLHLDLFARAARQGDRGSAGPAERGGDDPTYTIADVAKACGLPQPVIAQLVPRTWTKDGWMYTGAQRLRAIQIAQEISSPAD